jgi:hypothetical protein
MSSSGHAASSSGCAIKPRVQLALLSAASQRDDARDATGVPVAALKQGMGDIVAISYAILVGVGGRHAIAAVIEEAADQDRGRVFDANPPRSHIFGELGLDRFEGGAINDGLVLAGMPAATPTLKQETRNAIVLAVAKARSWIDDLTSGRIQSFTQLAQQERKVERHIRLLIPLAFGHRRQRRAGTPPVQNGGRGGRSSKCDHDRPAGWHVHRQTRLRARRLLSGERWQEIQAADGHHVNPAQMISSKESKKGPASAGPLTAMPQQSHPFLSVQVVVCRPT